MNLPKFIKDDERLFRLLLGDLFPSLELPISEYGALQVSKMHACVYVCEFVCYPLVTRLTPSCRDRHDGAHTDVSYC